MFTKRKVSTVIFGLIVSQLITWGAYGPLASMFLPTHYTVVEPLCTDVMSTYNCNTYLSLPLPPPSFAAVLFVIIAAEAMGFVGVWMLAIMLMDPCRSDEGGANTNEAKQG